MSMITSRRDVLSGASALAASALATGVGLTATAAALGPDAELLALRGPWLDSVETFSEALDMLAVAETRVYAHPNRPPPISEADFVDADDVEQRYLSLREERDLAHAAIDDECGLTAAKVLESETSSANEAVVDQIIELAARTLAGIRFKVEVSENEGHHNAHLVASIMEDVAAFADREGARA